MNETTITVDIGHKAYAIASDDNYLNHIKNGFEPDTVALLNSLLRDSDVVFDVGANIGCTSILFGERCRKVYSFEPSPTTFKFLQRNLSNAGLNNVVPMNMGLGSCSCESELTFDPSNRSMGFVSDKTQASLGHTIEKIKIERADNVAKSMDLPTLDFIKIDAEGFEKSVIEGAEGIIRAYKPIVVLELNHWCLNAFQRITIPDFFDFLRAHFPILLAVEGNTYRDLHNPNQSFYVMYHHVVNFRYMSLIGAFSEERLSEFYKHYDNPDSITENGQQEERPSEFYNHYTFGELNSALRRLASQQEEISAAVKKSNDLMQQRNILQDRVDAIELSHSWKITAPLRHLSQLFSR